MKRPESLPYRVYVKIAFGVGPRACWIWTGAADPRGYGFTRDEAGRFTQSHRYVWEKLKGRIPYGKQLDHVVCNNPACCHPGHLRPSTARQNILRGRGPAAVNTRKTHCKHGHSLVNPYWHVSRDGTRRRHCRTCRNEASKRKPKK